MVNKLSREGLAPETLVESTENDGEFDWAIPADQEPGDDYVVTVSFVEAPGTYDSSNKPFALVLLEDCPIPEAPTGITASDSQNEFDAAKTRKVAPIMLAL
jgi:hypothetical protein